MAKYQKPGQEQSPAAGILSGMGVVAGIAVGSYAPFALLVPGLAAGAMGLALAMFLQPPRSAFTIAVALPFGQGVWMLVGMFLLQVTDPFLLAEALALVLAPLLFLFAPPLIPAIPLAAFQMLGLVVNVLAFAEAKPGSVTHQALLVHIVFRVGTIGAMIAGVVSWYSQPSKSHRPRDEEEGGFNVELTDEVPLRPRRPREEDEDDRPWRASRPRSD